LTRARAVRLGAAVAAVLALVWGVRALAAELVVASLSQHDVALTTGFAGSEIFVYGAVRRTDPGPEPEGKLDILITVTGPLEPVVVRRKERHFGIWTNGPSVEVDAAPSFYVVASSGGFRETITWTDDLRFRVGLDYAITLIDAPAWVDNREEYRLAVARVREAEGLYSVLPNSVRIIENTLFETRVELPADLIEGDYTARVFLVRDRRVLDVFTDTIEVRRAPLGRFIYLAAREHAALYGAASLALALAAGWLASAFFRTFFPT
jgi:uncharacterized protein (TIGR02186 family)